MGSAQNVIFYDIFCDLVAGPQLKPTDVIASFAVDSTPVIIRALLRAKNGEGALDLDGSDEDVSCAKPALSTIKDASLAKPALSAIENAPLAKGSAQRNRRWLRERSQWC